MEPTTEPNAVSVLAGLLSSENLALQFGKSTRTVIRWERQGMPVIKLGMTRLYDPVAVRAWLLTHEYRHDIPKRGRPSKHAA